MTKDRLSPPQGDYLYVANDYYHAMYLNALTWHFSSYYSPGGFIGADIGGRGEGGGDVA